MATLEKRSSNLRRTPRRFKLGILLMASIAFSLQHFYEYQIDEARKMSQQPAD